MWGWPEASPPAPWDSLTIESVSAKHPWIEATPEEASADRPTPFSPQQVLSFRTLANRQHPFNDDDKVFEPPKPRFDLMPDRRRWARHFTEIHDCREDWMEVSHNGDNHFEYVMKEGFWVRDEDDPGLNNLIWKVRDILETKQSLDRPTCVIVDSCGNSADSPIDFLDRNLILRSEFVTIAAMVLRRLDRNPEATNMKLLLLTFTNHHVRVSHAVCELTGPEDPGKVRFQVLAAHRLSDLANDPDRYLEVAGWIFCQIPMNEREALIERNMGPGQDRPKRETHHQITRQRSPSSKRSIESSDSGYLTAH